MSTPSLRNVRVLYNVLHGAVHRADGSMAAIEVPVASLNTAQRGMGVGDLVLSLDAAHLRGEASPATVTVRAAA